MITQSAAVDQRAGKLIVTSYSQATSGLWIGNHWSILDANVEEAELGNAIREALSRTELGIPKPSRDELARLDKPKLQALGVRSTSAYMRGTKSVVLDGHDDGHLAVTPTENRHRDGFVEIEAAKALLPADIAPAELAAAVRTALEQATDRPA